MSSSFFPGDPLSRQRFPLREILEELPPASLVLWHYYSLKKKEYRKYLHNLAEIEKQLRLPTMFFAGGLAALLAGRYLQVQSPPWRYRLGSARLFSLWANYLILADAASDRRELGAKASRDFLQKCLAEIFYPVVDGNKPFQDVAADLVDRCLDLPWPLAGRVREVPPSPLGGAALRLAHLFGQQAASCLAIARNHAAAAASFALFFQRMLTLLQGQWASLQQGAFDAQHQWEWYRGQVLDAKFTNVLLAPLALLSTSEEEARRREVLEQGLGLVSSLYLHRQLLDDLLDVESDCLEGIFGGPAYLFLAVGRQESSPGASAPFPADGLGVLPQTIMRWIGARNPEALRKEAAACRAFQLAWPRQKREAARILQGSQTVRALLHIIQDPQRIKPICRRLHDLLAQEPGAAAPLKYYHYRCARTFRKMAANFPPLDGQG